MGAFHYAKDSGNSNENEIQMKRSVLVFSDRNIQDHLELEVVHIFRSEYSDQNSLFLF